MQSKKIQPVRVNELTPSSSREYIPLSGIWNFQLDPDKKGEDLHWFSPECVFTDTIQVPGCLEAQGKGLKYLELTPPGWSGTCDMPYLGISWYGKSFQVPAGFKGKTILLNFGGISTDCKIWLNGIFIGEHHHACTPFGFDVTGLVYIGKSNHLSVLVENQHHYEAKQPSNRHGLGSTTIEIRWSGIFRDVELVAVEPVHLTDLFITPDAQSKKITCHYAIDHAHTVSGLTVKAAVTSWKTGTPEALCEAEIPEEGRGELEVKLPDAELWEEANPALYLLELTLLNSAGEVLDTLTERFGLRDIRFDGKHILLNGKPVYLRGDMTHYHWPVTISPSTDRKDLKEKLATYEKYGFNFLRHHTHFPFGEYLDACDELGLLCHCESSVISNLWPIFPEDREEMWENLIISRRNHPSAIIWCFGNETDTKYEEMKKYAEITYRLDKSRLVQTNSPGWFIYEDGTMQRAPVIHEYRSQGSSYIDTSLKEKYTPPQRPWRMLFAEQEAEKSGMKELLPLFTRNTQLLQAQCRKILLETARLDEEPQGYELGTFRDTGSFVWGVVDDFFGQKVVPPQELKQYNSETVLILTNRWQQRIYQYDSDYDYAFTVKCSHFAKEPVVNDIMHWKLVDDAGQVLASGSREGIRLSCGSVGKVLTFDYKFRNRDRAKRVRLTAELHYSGGKVSNSWDLWVFPMNTYRENNSKVYWHRVDFDLRWTLNRDFPFVQPLGDELQTQDLLLAGKVDQTLVNHLSQGGRAILVGLDNFDGEMVEWGAGRSEFPRGTLIQPHPLMDKFPHEGWCDIPFAGLMNGLVELSGNRNARFTAVNVDQWPGGIKPVIQAIPSYKQRKPQKMALLFEVNVGKGKLLVTTFQFGLLYESCHDAWRLENPAKHYLLNEMFNYTLSKDFNPQASVDPAFLQQWIGREGSIHTQQVIW